MLISFGICRTVRHMVCVSIEPLENHGPHHLSRFLAPHQGQSRAHSCDYLSSASAHATRCATTCLHVGPCAHACSHAHHSPPSSSSSCGAQIRTSAPTTKANRITLNSIMVFLLSPFRGFYCRTIRHYLGHPLKGKRKKAPRRMPRDFPKGETWWGLTTPYAWRPEPW